MKKIAIIGPESTGKTELAKKLAEYFKSPWEPEYAREYVEKLTTPYTYEDVCNIAKYQINQEKFYEKHPEINADYVFFDTDLIITKVWFQYKFGKVPDFLIERLNQRFFDFYFLCYPDLLWQPDSVREHGDDREFFFDWYRKEIEELGKPYFVVKGFGEERTQCAIKTVLSFCKK